MSKFNLFSRAALAGLVGASGGNAVVIAADPAPADPAQDPAKDPAKDPADPETPPAEKPEKEGDPADPAKSDPEDPAPDAAGEFVTVADAAAVARDAVAGERARTAAVFSDASALANPSMAAWMLQNSPDASAESIVKQLSSMPGAKPGANTTTPAADIPDTNVDLGRGDPQAALDVDAAADGKDPWVESSKRVFGSAPAAATPVPAGMVVGRSDRSPFAGTTLPATK